MDILITEDIKAACLDRLAEKFSVARDGTLWKDKTRLAEAIRDARAIVIRNQTQITAELLAGAPKLMCIGRHGVGLDNIDMPAASKAGVVVIAPLDANAMSVAEHTFALMLALARKIPHADRSTRAGGWDRLKFTGTELAGKTVCICGFGRIGRRVATRAKVFEMRVVVFDPFVKADSPLLAESGATLCNKLDDALAQADFVTTHSPLTPETKRMFNKHTFAEMKRGAFFVNTSRGGVVDEAALLAALRNGHLGGAGLDVRETEPPTVRGEFEVLENVVLTPHIASFTIEAQDRTAEGVASDVERVLNGQPAVNAVNFATPKK
ncbi:MAG: hydroxyacid dehydrogenase [Verrucomicrobia bacterium]|nr:hydroxyacid dehydrogenase [Verrucomicrobiota bacterium]